jgi:hypothetical protein
MISFWFPARGVEVFPHRGVIMPSFTKPYRKNIGYSILSTSTGNNPNQPAWPLRGNQSLDGTDSRSDGGPVAGFRYLISHGYNATSSLSGSKITADVQEGSAKLFYYQQLNPTPREYNWHGLNGVLTQPTIPSTTGPSVTAADNMAKMLFVRKARQAQTAIQGGVFLGELREALHLIRHPAQGFRRGLDDYLSNAKKRRKGTRQDKRRFLSESWLEYSFGWAPLINDIRSGSEALSRLQYRPPFKMVSAFGEDIQQTNTMAQMSGGACTWNIGVKTERKAVVIYRGVVDLSITNPVLLTAQNFGFTPQDFVPTIWELIPYSFLVDYFTNIGDILSGWSFNTSALRWISRTQVTKATDSRVTLGLVKPSLPSSFVITDHSLTPCKSVVINSAVSRATYSGSLVPSLAFEIPGMRSLKWLNLAALARTHRSLLPF